MIYVEYLRSRRLLMWWTVGIALFLTVPFYLEIAHLGEIRAQIAHSASRGSLGRAPLSVIVAGCVFFAYIFASIIGSSLGREKATLPIAWTKPVPRELAALAVSAIDLLAVLAAAAIAFVLCMVLSLPIAGYQMIEPDGRTAGVLAITLGCAAMWYAEVQLISVLAKGGNAVSGLSWPVFMGLTGGAAISILPEGLHRAFVAVNVLNPLAWSSGASYHSQHGNVGVSFGSSKAVFGVLPMWESIVVPWLIAALCLALSAYLWKTKEA